VSQRLPFAGEVRNRGSVVVLHVDGCTLHISEAVWESTTRVSPGQHGEGDDEHRAVGIGPVPHDVALGGLAEQEHLRLRQCSSSHHWRLTSGGVAIGLLPPCYTAMTLSTLSTSYQGTNSKG